MTGGEESTRPAEPAGPSGQGPPVDQDAVARRKVEVRKTVAGLRSLGQPNSTAKQFDFANESHEWRRVFAEVFGTFLLVLAAAGGPIVNARFGGHAISPAALVIAPGLMVLAIILFMGTVSGAHMNPAVTIAFMLRSDFPARRVPLYIIAQFAGAVVATLVVVALVGKHGTAGLTLPGHGISAGAAMAWEVVLTTGLVSVITGTASGGQQIGAMSAIAVGSYIALAGLIGAPVSGASMNPVRSLGPALVLGDWTAWWAYLLGPLLGALVAVAFAQILRGRGGGEFSRRAAQGTLGTGWLPGRRERAAGQPAGPSQDGAG